MLPCVASKLQSQPADAAEHHQANDFAQPERHCCCAHDRYKCVIVLCDSQWCDPDLDSNNGIQMGLRDMLRIDSMLMMVQLNIRVLLEVGSLSTQSFNTCIL